MLEELQGHSRVVSFMYINMATLTQGDLFTVDFCHKLVEAIQFHVKRFKVFDMVHFHLTIGATVGARLSKGRYG